MTSKSVIQAAGVVIFRLSPSGQKEYLLVQNKRGEWTPPKGKLNYGESWAQGAIREVKEETGLRKGKDYWLLRNKSYEICYVDESRKRPRVKKTVYYLGLVSKEVNINLDSKELKNYIWITAKKAIDLMNYPEMTQLIRYADY